eukprot:g77042.t1
MQVERVDVLYPPKPTKADVNYALCHRLEKARRNLRERETDIQQYQGMIRFQETFDEDGTMLLAPDWFTELHIYARAEKLAQFEEKFKRQAGRHQFPLIMEEAEQDEAAETKTEFKEYKELAKADRDNLFKDAFDVFKDCPPDELHQRLKDLKAKTDANEASAYEKIQLASRRPMISSVFDGLDHDVVLAPLRNKLRDSDCANLPTATIPYLPAACNLHAFDLLGVKDVGLEGQTLFTKADIIAKRKEIIELTNRAARAGGKRLQSHIKSDKSSFAAKVKRIRKKNTEGSQEREVYEILHNKDVVNLAMASNAYEKDSDDTLTSVSLAPASIVPPPVKKRRTDLAANQTQLIVDDDCIGIRL